MIRPRSASLFLSILALPLAAVANSGTATATAVTGNVSATLNNNTTAAKEGQEFTQGYLLETSANSSLTVTLPSGGKLVLAPNTKIRIRSFSQAEDPSLYSLEILLVRGSVTGDATKGAAASNLTIRTTGGVASVAGTAFAVDFAPDGGNGGTIQLASTIGVPSLTPANGTSAVAVQPNNSVSVTKSENGTGTPQSSPLTTARKEQIGQTLGGTPVIQGSTPADGTTISISTGTTAGARVPNVLYISPNGEGTLTL